MKTQSSWSVLTILYLSYKYFYNNDDHLDEQVPLYWINLFILYVKFKTNGNTVIDELFLLK